MFAWRLITRGGIGNRESGGRSDLTLRFGTKPGTTWPDSAEGAGNCFHSQTSHLLPLPFISASTNWETDEEGIVYDALGVRCDSGTGLDHQVSADSMRWHDDLSNTHQLSFFLCAGYQLLLPFRSQQFLIHSQRLLAVFCRLRGLPTALRDCPARASPV